VVQKGVATETGRQRGRMDASVFLGRQRADKGDATECH
jgi:hypothetical protein